MPPVIQVSSKNMQSEEADQEPYPTSKQEPHTQAVPHTQTAKGENSSLVTATSHQDRRTKSGEAAVPQSARHQSGFTLLKLRK